MDLNQLLYNHQLAMINAQRVTSGEPRDSHFDLVVYYAKRIKAWRDAKGLSGIGWPIVASPTSVTAP